MKTIALIGLIIVATASAGMAAETSLTIQTNTGIRIDPVTGQVKGDAETQVRGIRKHHEVPEAVNTSATGTSVANTGAATTPVALTTPTDPNTATTPVSVATPTGLDTGTAPVGAAPPTDPVPRAYLSQWWAESRIEPCYMETCGAIAFLRVLRVMIRHSWPLAPRCCLFESRATASFALQTFLYEIWSSGPSHAYHHSSEPWILATD